MRHETRSVSQTGRTETVSAAAFPSRRLKPVKGVTDPRLFAVPISQKSDSRPANAEAQTAAKRRIDQVARVCDALEARESQLKERAAAILRRAQRSADRLARIEADMCREMSRAGVTLLDGVTRQLRTQDAPPAMEVWNEKLVPTDYMRTPKTPPSAPDKVALKKAFADHPELDPELYGCRLSRRLILIRK